MGRRGPPPKPTALKLLAGNPGHRPINGREPQPEICVPPCPRQLSPEAKKEWRRISKELMQLGLLTNIDRAALAGYCQTWGRWIEAEDRLREHGVIVKAPNGYPVQSPYLKVAESALKQMTRLLVEFGMSPSARSRITVTKPKDPTKKGFFDT